MTRRGVGRAVVRTFVVSVVLGALCATAVAQDGRTADRLGADASAALATEQPLHATSRARPSSIGAVPTFDVAHADRLENTDPRLRTALAGLSTAPSPLTLCLVAEAYAAAGVLDTAYDRASDAITADPRNARAYDLRARLWRRWGMPERGLGDAHRAAYYAPWSPEAQSALGTMHEALCQPEPARSAYIRALRLDSSAVYARANLERMRAQPADAGPCGPDPRRITGARRLQSAR